MEIGRCRRAHMQLIQTAKHGVFVPFEGLLGTGELRETFKQFLEDDFCLQASQRHTEAQVDAIAEADVSQLFTGDVEFVGPIIDLRIAIGGRQRDHQDLALFEVCASEFEVLFDDACGELHRRFNHQAR